MQVATCDEENARVVEKHVDRLLLRRELCCRCLDRLETAQVQLEEERLFARLCLQLRDRLGRLALIAPCDVHLGVVLKQALQSNPRVRQRSASQGVCTLALTVCVPIPAYPPVTTATRPVRSGMFCGPQVAVGGKACVYAEYAAPIVLARVEERRMQMHRRHHVKDRHVEAVKT
jgi:hypothetical protein